MGKECVQASESASEPRPQVIQKHFPNTFSSSSYILLFICLRSVDHRKEMVERAMDWLSLLALGLQETWDIHEV